MKFHKFICTPAVAEPSKKEDCYVNLDLVKYIKQQVKGEKHYISFIFLDNTSIDVAVEDCSLRDLEDLLLGDSRR